MRYKKIDIDSWKRKPHYLFFKDFDEPFFGVAFNVKVGKGYEFCKEHNRSFFIYYLYAVLKAVNAVKEFRYRIVDDVPVVFDTVSISPTVKRDDGTFGFSYMEYAESFAEFYKLAEMEMKRVRVGNDLVPSENDAGTIHFSALPWLKFTSLSHARSFRENDSVPKISVGKLFEEGGALMMPVSVHVNHALADGVHVGKFAEEFEGFLNKGY
ncbi:chloramphenicol acetyltransferase [Robertkochia flava]|uniref:chloramphenicol acetyltransferase n=1 Tax=Robertkochia flava TaxID=3447986 RepID=UPI001CC9CD4D|nr:chloramphenicol acetyltransferase [Robertkochia marina]